jgi:hypothetical protein
MGGRTVADAARARAMDLGNRVMTTWVTGGEPLVIQLDRFDPVMLEGLHIEFEEIEAHLQALPEELGLKLNVRLDAARKQQEVLEKQLDLLEEQTRFQEVMEGIEEMQIEVFHRTDGEGGITIDLDNVRHQTLEWSTRGKRIGHELEEMRQTLEEEARRGAELNRERLETRTRLQKAVKLVRRKPRA